MAESPADRIKNLRATNVEYDRQIASMKNIENAEQRSAILRQQLLNNQKLINELIIEQGDNTTKNSAEIDALLKKEREIYDEQKKINQELEKQVKWRKHGVDLARQLVGQLKAGWQYLQDQDKIIKSTNLNLGMSGAKAVAMRNAFEQSAGYVTRLGGTIAEIGTVMQGYAEETGRARAMTADMVKDITAIGKGTGLGIEAATRLGAQFELMGYDAKGTMEYVQGVVDTTERMGVNTTKVLKNVNDNFKRLNTYTFQQGVKGFAQMASYAEKFKIDMSQALNAADVARSLEGAVDLAAQLQVMGGEFAKTDPFEMLFLSRNDPAKFTEKIADMTKGVVSFRKMADGSFEKFISPADRDRLASVAKSMGMEAGALTEMAERQAEIQKMRQQMAGLGLSKEQKEIIEGAATFDQKSGKFQVQIGNTMKSIGTLTSKQADAFKIERKTLEDRAKEAMTFNDTFNATIETLKAALLPLLKGVNKMLAWVSPVVDKLSTLAGSGWGGVATAGGILLGAAAAWKTVSFGLNMAAQSLIKTKAGGTVGKVVNNGLGSGGLGRMVTPTSKSGSGLFEMRKGQGMQAAGKGSAMKSMGAGAGVGMAAAGVGAGIMLAAKGIGELAKEMAKLDKTGLEALPKTVWAIAGAMTPFAIAIAVVGTASEVSAIGILALGAATLMVGAGIGIAAMGIGKMGEGLAKLNESGGGAGKQLLGVAGGIGAITLAMASGGGIGLIAMNYGLSKMSKNSAGVEKVGAAFAKIQTVLSGSKDDWIAVQNAVESIGNTNISGGSMLAQLGNLLKKPLEVKFAKGEVSLKNDVTLMIDGKKFMHEIYDEKIAVNSRQSLMQGYGS